MMAVLWVTNLLLLFSKLILTSIHDTAKQNFIPTRSKAQPQLQALNVAHEATPELLEVGWPYHVSVVTTGNNRIANGPSH